MNIDLWESAGELWARWGRGCIMVQQNWRFVGETPAADSPAALFYADVSEKFRHSVSFYDHPREPALRDGKKIQASLPRLLLL